MVSRSKETESRLPRQLPALPLMLLALAACGGADLLLPSAGQPSRIRVVSGNGQTDTVGRALPESLVVRVTDPEDRPVKDVEVAFTVPAGATLAPNDTVVTGPDGQAAVHYVLATLSGEQTIGAHAKPVVPSEFLTTSFAATALPETAVQLIAANGDDQEGEVRTALPESLAVKAVDRFLNGVAGIEVTWEAADGSVNPATGITGTDGRAATQRTLGNRAGTYRTTATTPGLEGSPVVFEAIGVAPPSPQLVLVTPPSSAASAGVPFERQPVLQLQDALGAPLARGDVPVTVQIAEGGGSLGGTTTARSNGEGRVTFTDLSIRGGPGDRTLLFATSDFTPATSGVIDVNPGPPAPGRSSATVPSGTAGAGTTISIHLEDEFGTAIEGVAGAVSVTVGGANSGTASVQDLGDGSYSASYTPTVTGTDQITVEVNGTPVTGSPLASTVAPGAAAASTTTAQVTRAGSFFFEVIILVTTRDAQGNLLGRGGERVQVQVDGGDALRDARDNGDGTYSDQFVTILSNPGVIITLNGEQIAGNPFLP